MAGIEGPFHLTKFCGASVTKIQSNAGWQEQISSLRVDLVEGEGDRFIVPEPGTPLSFIFEGFRFDGIVQNHNRSRSPSGNPLYSVTLYSPVEILEAVQIILDAYRGANLILPNLLNVFGFLEGEGDAFGGSGKNESGIAWYKVKKAIEAIQEGGTDFSPGILYKGHTYKVDFGGMPQVPDFYRLGGAFISLNQAVRTVFEDSSHDFIVLLKKAEGNGPHTIYFKSRSRLIQEPLGQIAAFVEGKENIISFEEGAELRNDITCGVILGGEQENIISMVDVGDGQNIWNFWGFQQTPFLVPFATQGNQPIVESTGFGNEHTALLNAMPIADIVGSPNGGPPVYECSVFEMRMALVDFDCWSAFIARKRPEIVEALGLQAFPCVFSKDDFSVNPQSFYATDADAVAMLSNNWLDKDPPPIKAFERMWEFVRTSAETYIGRQFIVRIPFFLKYYFEEETNHLFYNVSVNGDGYYPDYIGGWNSGPLGLNYENFNFFMNDSGKFTPFLRFSGADVLQANLNALSSDEVIIQGQDIYVRCDVEQNVIFTPAPAVLCRLNTPIWSLPPDPVGGIKDIAWLCDMEVEDLISVLQIENGEFPLKIHPWPLSPQGAAICLKSNEFTYGPWYKIGVPGKVKIEQDSGLVPWNYGGFEIMKVAAEAQLAEIGSTSQREESGQIVFVGAPDISLGDQLSGAGPVVTSIDVEVDDSGVKTTYRMRSQTPAYGTFSKQNADRLRRLGVAAQDLRRTMRALVDRLRAQDRIAVQSRWVYAQNVSRAINNRESTSVLQAFVTLDPVTGNYIPQVSAKTFAGSIGASNAHNNEKFKMTAAMGMEGLIRPFSTDPTAENIPKLKDTPEANALNPFALGSDIMWAVHGNTYNGMYAGSKSNNTSQGQSLPQNPDDSITHMRVLGLRGPLVVVGWGKDMKGNIVPDAPLSTFKDWKAGPVDLRWFDKKGVWSFPTIAAATYIGNDTARVQLSAEDYLDFILEPWLAADLSDNQRIIIGYSSLQDNWYIMSANC